MIVYKSRYHAKKYANADDVIIKVSGGYVCMDPRTYRMWTQQK
jgi:hypothetical protein